MDGGAPPLHSRQHPLAGTRSRKASGRSGGVLLTLRFDVPDEESEREKIASIVMKVAASPGSRAHMFSRG